MYWEAIKSGVTRSKPIQRFRDSQRLLLPTRRQEGLCGRATVRRARLARVRPTKSSALRGSVRRDERNYKILLAAYESSLSSLHLQDLCRLLSVATPRALVRQVLAPP